MVFSNTEVFNFKGAIRGMRNPLASWGKSDSVFDIFCEHEDYDMSDEVAASWAEFELKDQSFATDDEEEKAYNKEYEHYHEWLWSEGVTSIGTDHHYKCTFIGPNDLDLMKRLIKAGPEHRKFLRQIFVIVDITAPRYWWSEFDTYRVGTAANSTSTMHKLASTPIKLDCFETDDLDKQALVEVQADDIPNHIVYDFLEWLELCRVKYNETKDKRYWKELIRWLPAGWLQTRTVTLNYENILSMLHQRANHKLNEWSGIDDASKEYFCKWAWNLPYVKYLFADVIEKKDRWEDE